MIDGDLAFVWWALGDADKTFYYLFRALDKQTGAAIWQMELPGGTSAVPMTYMVGGKQFIAVTIAGGSRGAEVIAMALP